MLLNTLFSAKQKFTFGIGKIVFLAGYLFSGTCISINCLCYILVFVLKQLFENGARLFLNLYVLLSDLPSILDFKSECRNSVSTFAVNKIYEQINVPICSVK